jgi:SAM-dependent methyltransferase
VTDRRDLFGDAVDDYDAGRPPYPERVYELLVQRCGLGPGAKVVEVGPGTGQATGRLLSLGATVTAVELDERLAQRLRSKHDRAGLSVAVSSFEDADLPAAAFDLVVAATSFHWVDPGVGLVRAADVLRPGGWLALWWNVFGDRSRPDPFGEALLPFIEACPELAGDPPGAGAVPSGSHPYSLDVEARIAEIDATGRFGPVHHEMIRWTGRHTPAQLRALFASYSPWLALPDTVRLEMLATVESLARNTFAGVVERPYLTPVYLAQRRVAPPPAGAA